MYTCDIYIYIYIYIYVHYLHFLDYCPDFFHHVYHNLSAIVRSSLLQVVGMLNLNLYFTYRG